MKQLLLAAVLAASSTLFSCHDEVSNTENIEHLKDTLFKTYPAMAGVSVEVEEWHELNVVVRSKQLYNTSTENKQKVTAEIGQIAQAVFGTNNELDKGQVIFTKNERSTEMKPADGENYPITFPGK
jgi:hypothetical protein